MAKKSTGLPENWQATVLKTMEQMRKDDVTKDIFGLSFPMSWKPHLLKYVRSGDVRRMFKVRAITFSGDTIGRFDAPQPKSAPKPEETKKAS